MAGFLSLYNAPQRIEVAEGYWIDVKTNLTTEDYEAAQRALIGKMTMIGGGELRSEPDTIAYQHELVLRAIVDWNLTDENDAPLPLEPADNKRASIKRLPQSVFLTIYEQVSEASAPRSKDDEVSFRASGESSAVGNG